MFSVPKFRLQSPNLELLGANILGTLGDALRPRNQQLGLLNLQITTILVSLSWTFMVISDHSKCFDTFFPWNGHHISTDYKLKVTLTDVTY